MAKMFTNVVASVASRGSPLRKETHMADGDNLLLGKQNTSSSETRITCSGTTPNVSALVVDNDHGNCVVGNSTFVDPLFHGGFAGVVGTSSTGNGVQGVSQEGIGVLGRCPARNGTAVRGEAPERGGTGVRGEAEFTGVFGLATPGPREGAAVGVFGEADLEAASDGEGTGFGVMGVERSGEGWAGTFFGRVDIGGDLRVGGDLTVEGVKSAVLRHSDGSLRRMYALESPESWFEDFGRAEVVDGRAQVELDNEFAAMVHTDDYHVFLTPEGETQGLYVSARRPDGFEVHEQQGGASNLTFSYRVVAKRSDIEVQRLQRIEPPPALAEVHRPQSPPKPPESRY
jgi:hypothetical protein